MLNAFLNWIQKAWQFLKAPVIRRWEKILKEVAYRDQEFRSIFWRHPDKFRSWAYTLRQAAQILDVSYRRLKKITAISVSDGFSKESVKARLVLVQVVGLWQFLIIAQRKQPGEYRVWYNKDEHRLYVRHNSTYTIKCGPGKFVGYKTWVEDVRSIGEKYLACFESVFIVVCKSPEGAASKVMPMVGFGVTLNYGKWDDEYYMTDPRLDR